MIYDWKRDVYLIIIFILVVGIFFLVNKADTIEKFKDIKDSACLCENKKFNIPDKTFTDDACKLAGYDWGIIDTNSRCGTSIECFKNVGNTLTIDCFEVG